MGKHTAAIIRTLTFVCVFAVIFVAAGKATGILDTFVSSGFEPFGEETGTGAVAGTTQGDENRQKKSRKQKQQKEKTTADTAAASEAESSKKNKNGKSSKSTQTAQNEKTTEPAATLPCDNNGDSLKVDENGESYREIVPESLGKDWYARLVVRREIRVSEDYQPDLVPILEGLGYGCTLNRVAAKPYDDMYYAALNDGICLVPYSAYRSYGTQYDNFVNRIAQWQSQGYSRQQAIEKTVEVIMAPGGSEHNIGLAVDIICTDYDFNKTAAYAWLSENAYKYGFIERYPENSHDITGVVREPWHWRFVGKKTAKEMHGKGYTFEEYLIMKGIDF